MIEFLMTPAPAPPVPAATGEVMWGMPLPAVLAVISLASVVLGALVSGIVKKFRTPADDTQDRVVVLDASDRLIQRFENLLRESDTKHQREINELSSKVDDLEAQVNQLRDERLTMLGALRAVIAIAKKFGGRDAVEEIRHVDMPDSIRI